MTAQIFVLSRARAVNAIGAEVMRIADDIERVKSQPDSAAQLAALAHELRRLQRVVDALPPREL